VNIGDHDLPEGLYESLLTEHLAGRLKGLPLTPELESVDEADVPHVLARHVTVAVERTLKATRNTDERLTIVNSLLDHLM
jgi:hypothetical protein